MDAMDISYIDVNELGIRPLNWTGDETELDFDELSNGYFSKEKSNESKSCLTDEEEEEQSILDEDDQNYQTDPETGEKTFREVPVSSSPAFASSNDTWIEEYLSHIESSARQILPTTSTPPSSDFLFENIPVNTEQADSYWLSKYISPEESTTNIMFPDQHSNGQFVDDQEKISPIFIPSTSHQSHPDSLLNLLSVSIDDDEHSIGSSSSGGSQRRRLFSSLTSESMTRDSEFAFNGSFIETKLEKIEPDEHFVPHLFMRRSSTRSSYQYQQDEETLHQYQIPLTLYDITQSSTEEYNRHLGRLSYLSPEQIHIIKDIRRRGKNKIAAQNCRKRKAISVESLLEEVDELKRVKHELEERKKSYQQQIDETRHLYEYLHHHALPDRQLPPAIIVQ